MIVGVIISYSMKKVLRNTKSTKGYLFEYERGDDVGKTI